MQSNSRCSFDEETWYYSENKKAYQITTQSNHSYRVAENLLKRNFSTKIPNEVWVSDITYIPTAEGWLYLAVTLDIYSRKVVGWAMDSTMNQKLVMEALNQAIQQRRPKPGLIHHSDRGSQYAANAFQELLRKHHIKCSMSRKGDCWDNTVMESFSLYRSWCMNDLQIPI